NLALVIASDAAEKYMQELTAAIASREPHALLSSTTRDQLHQSVEALQKAGAKLLTGGKNVPGKGYRYASTLLRVSGKAFLAAPEELQREAFGNEVMAIVAADEAELLQVIEHL